MSQGEATRSTGIADAHLADRAADGDADAFSVLAARFHHLVWTTAALASADTDLAVRATAGAFTRTLAARAAGIGDLGAPIGRALAATGYELAGEGPGEDGIALVDLPPGLAALSAADRVSAWLTATQGWTDAAVIDLLAAASGLAGPDRRSDRPGPEASAAARDLVLPQPAGLARAIAIGWREWQGLGLTIASSPPSPSLVARLGSPLGRVGGALTRGVDTESGLRPRRGTATRDATPALVRRPAEASAVDGRDGVGPTPDLGPEADDALAPPDRGGSGRTVVAAPPPRHRVLAVLAAGLLTAAAIGSLLTADTTRVPGPSLSAAEAAPVDGTEADRLLDDGRRAVPVVATEDPPASTTRPTGASGPPGTPVPSPAPASPGPTPAPADPDDTDPADRDRPAAGGSDEGATNSPSGPGAAPAPTGGGGDPVPTPSPAPPPSSPSPPPPPAPTSPLAPTPAPTTAPAPAPTTAPAPPPPSPPPPTTTTPPPPPTTTEPPGGPLCTLLPALCR